MIVVLHYITYKLIDDCFLKNEQVEKTVIDIFYLDIENGIIFV